MCRKLGVLEIHNGYLGRRNMSSRRIAINQPNFIPWIGYFDLIDSVDLFIFLDDAKLPNRTYVNRNKIYDANKGDSYLTLSVKKDKHNDLINQKVIHWDLFREKHLSRIRTSYNKAPYFNDVYSVLVDFYCESNSRLSDFNMSLIEKISTMIGISTEFKVSSRDFPSDETGQKKLEYIVCKIKPEQYYNFKKGVEIGLHSAQFYSNCGVELYKQEYLHPTYKHVSFRPYLSIIDLLFYQLPDALEIIRSGRNWIKVN